MSFFRLIKDHSGCCILDQLQRLDSTCGKARQESISPVWREQELGQGVVRLALISPYFTKLINYSTLRQFQVSEMLNRNMHSFAYIFRTEHFNIVSKC